MQKLIVAAILTGLLAITALTQSTAFTYQGHLTDGGVAANGAYDFQFWLFDTLADGTGTQIGTANAPNTQVTNGSFTVTIDFGANAFPGADRFMQIVVRPTNADPTVRPTILSPREQLTGTPYAVRSLSAATADTATNATRLGGTAAGQFVLTGDTRLSDARPPTPGSTSYIQNTTAAQAGSFNISGDGTIGGNLNVTGSLSLNTVNTATQYNIGGVRVLSNAGASNFFAGQGAGQSNANGSGNSFFGNNAGQANTDGISNSFLGNAAGSLNSTGSFNAFFGTGSGRANVDGNNNAFFGYTSGRNNASGFNNSFFGNAAGFANTSSGNNSFFGFSAGNQSSGTANSFFGASAGVSNTTGFGNTLVGNGADVASGNLSNANAIGSQAFVSQSNSLVLGSINGVNSATADTNVGIGTTAPSSRLHVVGDGLFTGNLIVNGNINGNLSLSTVNATTYNLNGSQIISAPGTNNFFAGQGTGSSITTGTANAFFGALAGTSNTSGAQNAFFGSQAGNQNSTGAGNSFFGAQAGKQNTGGLRNSFFGGNAGLNNTIGGDNSYFGVNAGTSNSSGGFNSMFGELAGQSNTTSFNSFFGYGAGQSTNTGDSNAFFGQNSGNSNTAGVQNAYFGTQAGAFSNGNHNVFIGTVAGAHDQTGFGNTALGDRADVAVGTLTNATAVGSRAFVGTSNSLVLGSISGTNGCTAANNCASTNVGIGTTSPTSRLHVVGDGLFTGNLTVNGTITGNLPANSNSYIQNTTTQQAATNFNIDGTGSANVFDATAFSLEGRRMLSNPGVNNLFLGQDSGSSITGGFENAFFGPEAGKSTTGGSSNSFFGVAAGMVNTNGRFNTFVGDQAGRDTDADDNSFIGAQAGLVNRVGVGNSFFGSHSGWSNVSGSYNSMFGMNSGNQSNGSSNSFFGARSGQSNTGSNNSFFGTSAGQNNAGDQNSMFGVNAGQASTGGFYNSFFGADSGNSNSTGSNNSYFGTSSGSGNSVGNYNSFFGEEAGLGNSGTGNTGIGAGATPDRNQGTLDNTTTIGNSAFATRSNSLILGGIKGVNNCDLVRHCDDVNVGIGTTAPQDRLHVNGSVRVTNGAIYITNPNTLIITSPNGACWGITVDNAGALSTFPVTCPQ